MVSKMCLTLLLLVNYWSGVTDARAPDNPLASKGVVTSTTIRIRWEGQRSVDRYRISYERVTGGQQALCPDVSHTGMDTVGGGSTRYTVRNLQEYSTYFITVTAVNTAGETPSTLTVTTLPEAPSSAPQDLRSTSMDETSISIQWGAVICIDRNSEITGYLLRYGEASGQQRGEILQRAGNGDEGGGATILGLNTLTTYYYFEVAAVSQNGRGPFATIIAPILLYAPGNPLVAEGGVTSTTIRIRWEGQESVDSYRISFERVTGGQQVLCPDVSNTGMETMNGSSTEYTVRDLQEYSTYSITVTAVNTAGETPSTLTATTLQAGPTGAPQSFTTSDVNSRNITVQWGTVVCIDRNSEITGYVLRYGEASSDQREEAVTAGSGDEGGTSTITGLTPYTEYCFEVAAVNSDSQTGPFIDTTSQTLQDQPGPVVALFATPYPTSLQLTWSAPLLPNGVITAYEVSRQLQGGMELGRVNTTDVCTTHTLTGLMPQTTYTVTVRAYTIAGSGEERSVTETTQAISSVSIEQVSYSVAEDGTGSVDICVTVTATYNNSFIVTFATEDGSAVSGGQAPDYLSVLINLAVRNDISECVSVTVYDDDLLEGTETFSVRISLATGAPDTVSIAINRADVFILDDDLATCPLDSAGGILWPLTEEGREAVENCSQAGPFYREGPVARRRCSQGGEWGEADFTGCTLTESVSEPFLLLWMVIEAEGVGDGGQLEEEMATILTERNVSFTSVTLVSLYLASIALTFEVKLNTSVDYQSSLTDFVQYFDEELTTLGEYDIRNGSKGTLAVVPSETCQCQTSEMSSILQLCTEASTSPCDCSRDQCTCQAPFVGDGSACTLDSDGDGYPDVPLATCDEGNEAIYCIKDVCPNVFNPEQDPRDCQGCPPGPDDQFMITWRYTEPGMTDTQPCPEGADGTARRMCGSDGQWEDPDVLDCQSQMFIDIADSVMTIQSSENLTVEEITMMTSDLVDRLINATEPESVSLLPRDINTTNFVISSLLEISEGSLNITVDLDIVEVINNLLNETNSLGFSQLQMIDSGSQSLLDDAERYGLLITRTLNSTNDEVLLSRPNIVVKATLYDLSNNQSLEFPREEDLVNYVRAEQGRPPARIEISPEVLEERMRDELAVPVVNILFRNLEDFLPSSGQNLGTDRSAISVVLSSQVGTQRDTLMSTSGSAIKLSFIAERVEEILGFTYNYTCNYWNFSRPVGNGDWINDGITITNITRTENATIVEAESLHLTSFAVLVDVAGGQEDVPDAEKMALQIISYIGCTVSVICLLITIGFFLLEGKQLLSAVHHFIHLNLALALLLGYLLFLVGVETATASTVVCAFVAALLQYIFLSAFCWMLCEGIMLYLKLVVVFSTLSKKWWMFLLIGWVTPVPIVVIGVGARHEYYGVRVNGELEFCWLSTEKGTIWGFVVPMLVIILINVVFLVFALRALWRSKTGQVVQNADSSVNARELAKVLLRATIILLPLLGLTWVFGILTLDENTTVFAWLFAIFNSLQGLMFFIFHVIRSDKVWSKITPLFSNVHKKVWSSTFEEGYEVEGSTRTSSTLIKRSFNRSTSRNTATQKRKAKSMEAKMLSISSIPASVGEDSQLELDVITMVNPTAQSELDDIPEQDIM